ncbi:unnamed protein product [Arabidopsis halleri]
MGNSNGFFTGSRQRWLTFATCIDSALLGDRGSRRSSIVYLGLRVG